MSKNTMISALGKAWILDIDGTVCGHNGCKLDGHDTLFPGAKQFFEGINRIDKAVFIISRSQAYAGMTESLLRENGIRWNAIVYDLPYGERILANDKKPSGLRTSIAVNTERDVFIEEIFIVDESLWPIVSVLKQFIKRRPFLAIPLTMITKILPGYRQYRKIVRRYESTVSVLRTAWHDTGDYYICGMYLPAFLEENGISNHVFLINKTGSERKITGLFDIYQGHTVQLHSIEPLSHFGEFMRQRELLCRSFEKSGHSTFIGE